MEFNSGFKGLKKIVYQVGINKGIILRCTAYQISRFAWNNSVPAGRIFVKFHTGGFYKQPSKTIPIFVKTG